MNEREDGDAFEMVVAALALLQGGHMALYHILLEIVIAIAVSQPEPTAWLDRLFESISAKLDQAPLETEGKRASGHERETLSIFFSVAKRAVQKRTRGPSHGASGQG